MGTVEFFQDFRLIRVVDLIMSLMVVEVENQLPSPVHSGPGGRKLAGSMRQNDC